MRGHQKNSSKNPYQSSITGAYFGIINILLVFIPLIYSLCGNPVLFYTYIFIGVLFFVLMAIIPFSFYKKYNYDFFSIRYLYFTGTMFLTFFLGIMAKYIIDFGVSFSNIYIVILQTILIVMTSFDIFISAHKGMKRMKSLYLRTIFAQYLKNAATILLGALAGLICLSFYI